MNCVVIALSWTNFPLLFDHTHLLIHFLALLDRWIASKMCTPINIVPKF
jgi:hypothetical protein